MTDYKKYINALRKWAKEHENDRTSIGHIIVSELCRDTANLLEELEPRWIPVSERLPEDFGTYLITLENGDVCGCDFNPDYIDEEHDKGAFTYYHDYYDNYTLALIDSEECVVDAIAWRTLEPYKAESEET